MLMSRCRSMSTSTKLIQRLMSTQVATQPSKPFVDPRVPHLHDLVPDSTQPGLSGQGVKSVALRDINPGETIFREKGELHTHPSVHSIQIGESTHCQIDGEGRFTAHSFSPNCGIIISPTNASPIEFVALRAIAQGDDLSFDYTTTEWDMMDGGFVDATTGQPVRGFKYLSDAQRTKLLDAGLLPKHILALWLQELQLK